MRRLDDFDLPWHLATGRVIATTHAIPALDPLAFTHRPLRYVEVVSDLAFYGVIHALGPLALQAVGALLACAIALLLFAQMRRDGPISTFVVGLAMVSMGSWLIVRPATLSFALLAAALLIVDQHRHLASDRKRKRVLAWLVPMQFVWVNTHGFAPLGAAVAAAYFVHRLAARLARGRLGGFLPVEDGTDLRFTGVVALLTALATTLNPGWRLLLGAGGYDYAGITEWARPTARFLFMDQPFVVVLVALAVLGVLFGRDAETGQRPPRAFDVVVSALVIFALFRATRMIPIATIVLAPIVARRLGGYVGRSARMDATCGFGAVLAAVLCLVRSEATLGVGFEPSHFPEASVRYIERVRPVGNMYDYWPYGGYLAWRLYPEHLVFMDGRNARAREPSLVERDRRALTDASAFAALVGEFDMQWAVMSAKENETAGVPLAADPAWTMVEMDDVGAVYVRNEGPNRRLAADGYRLLRHLTPPAEVLVAAVRGGRSAVDLAHDGALAGAQDPVSARGAFLEACGAMAIRDSTAFSSALDRLGRLAPEHPALEVLRSAWTAARERGAP